MNLFWRAGQHIRAVATNFYTPKKANFPSRQGKAAGLSSIETGIEN
jgi:hypothetical protein